jgi:hypothetical protein
MSTLAQLEARVSALLYDPANTNFSIATIDEALKQARDLYTDAAPLAMETVITAPGNGREIALSALTDLINVHDVWFPYDSTAAEVWPPQRVRGFRVWWDDAQPVLFLPDVIGSQPQTGDELRIFYTVPHTIQNLDSASITSIPAHHESHLCRGAAGLCALARAVDLNETATNMAVSTPNYAALANLYLNDPYFGFMPFLDTLRAQSNVRGEPFLSGWRMDKWDVRDNR